MEVDAGAQLFTTLLLMFGSALAAGAAPFFLRVRESHLQALAALGAGLLVGSALAVIIPEGFHAFAQVAVHSHSHAELHAVHDHDHDAHDHSAHDAHGHDHSAHGTSAAGLHAHGSGGVPEGLAGLVLVAGFLTMMLLDHAQHAAGGSCGHSHGHSHGGHSHGGHSHGHSHSCSPAKGLAGSTSRERLVQGEEKKEKEMGKGKDKAAAAAGGKQGAAEERENTSGAGRDASDGEGADKPAGPLAGKDADPSSAITGLIIHCCADGLAMGAAFLSGNARLTMLIAAAMVLHKAPMAFGLSTYLLACGWNWRRSAPTLLLFSATAPAATLATFGLLGSLTFLSSPAAVALCVLFSGGTFLHAATMHILPEVLQGGGGNGGRMGRLQMASVVVGALLPVALSWGHEH